MKVPIEITFRDIEKTASIEDLIRTKAGDLEKVCDYITSCSIAIEKPNENVKTGNPYRVRLSITVPPGNEIVVKREANDAKMHDPLPAVIRDAFKVAKRQLKKVVEKQREPVPITPVTGVEGISETDEEDLEQGTIL